MLRNLPTTITLRTPSGDVILERHWTRALCLICAAQTLASLVLLYGLYGVGTGTLTCSCSLGSPPLDPELIPRSTGSSLISETPLHAEEGVKRNPSPPTEEPDIVQPQPGGPVGLDIDDLVPGPVDDEIDDLDPAASASAGSEAWDARSAAEGLEARPAAAAEGGEGTSESAEEQREGQDKVWAGVTGGSAPAQGLPEPEAGMSRGTWNRTHLYGMSQALFPPGFVSFEAVLMQSRSDKKVHRFGHMYAEYLDPLRLQQHSVNMLEIGLRDGDSVNLWCSAFPAGKIYGLEYNPNPLSHASPSAMIGGRVTVFHGDQANVTLLGEILRRVGEEVGLLDFVVDDGGHTMQQQITSFTHLLPLVKPGGFYFIEDLQTSYWRNKCYHHWDFKAYCYGGGRVGKKDTTIDLMKSLIDVLNADFMYDHKNANKLGSGVYKVNPVDHLVGSIQCWRNMCAVRRKFTDHF